MPKSGKKLLVGILFLQLPEQQKSIHNARLNSHHMKSIKTSALPKMKGLIFHLETSCVPYVITSPAQTSAVTSFLPKTHMDALISSFPGWWNPLLCCFPSLFSAQGFRNTRVKGYISSHLRTAPSPPRSLRRVGSQVVKPE